MKRYLHLHSYKFIYHRFILETLVKSCTKNGCLLLDAGCGRRGSIVCPSDKVVIVGIDILRANVIACRLRWKSRGYVVADLTMLPFIRSAFGGVVSVEVLEHVNDKTAALNELARITQRGGFFVGCSTNILNLILWLDAKFPMLMKPLVMKLAEPGHYERHGRFSPSSLIKTLNLTGYRMDRLYLLGQPLFSKTRTPLGLALLWVLFDRLTKKKPLLYLKEVLVWQATRV
jgi:ubiquinone/menaquinone biosynthesis C-methylase UbiE